MTTSPPLIGRPRAAGGRSHGRPRGEAHHARWRPEPGAFPTPGFGRRRARAEGSRRDDGRSERDGGARCIASSTRRSSSLWSWMASSAGRAATPGGGERCADHARRGSASADASRTHGGLCSRGSGRRRSDSIAVAGLRALRPGGRSDAESHGAAGAATLPSSPGQPGRAGCGAASRPTRRGASTATRRGRGRRGGGSRRPSSRRATGGGGSRRRGVRRTQRERRERTQSRGPEFGFER